MDLNELRQNAAELVRRAQAGGLTGAPEVLTWPLLGAGRLSPLRPFA